ncbi:response regulator [Tenacibaculum sp. C7A-26P2]|uniref:response regulator n=1 Tax=Tenacibaculum sp. C7A-26P2 TaxID=3447504 RepID=UPI003F8702F6
MKKLILVIDDELTTCVLLENFLKKEYDVVTVSSALEALKKLTEFIPDLIISDIQMPQMNGFKLLEEIRLIGFLKHTPVIMLSGKTESSERIRCYRTGAQDYISKPFNPEELREVIKKNLYPLNYCSSW